MAKWYASAFPNLNSANHTQKSPYDGSYNCVAWAADRNNVIWWPREDHVWPIENKCGETVEAIIELFEWIGYCVCENHDFERGYIKIAIYAKFERTKVVPTHVAKQTIQGHWTSKLGMSIDIIHEKAENLTGPTYGKPVVFMKKKQPLPCS